MAATAPTGLVQKDTASNGGTIEITGDAAGDTITLYNGTANVGTGKVGAGGAFDIVTTATFADGNYNLTATDTSADGGSTSAMSVTPPSPSAHLVTLASFNGANGFKPYGGG